MGCVESVRVRRLVFLCIWILSLVAISCFGGTVSYGIFFGVTLLPVVSLIYILCIYMRFKIYQEVGSRDMVCGQSTPYFFALQNEDRFAFAGVSVRLFSSFSYVEEMPGNTEYELLPGDRITYETRLVCKYRGEYEVGIKEVVVTDFLRLFRVCYTNPGTIKALVRPKIVQLTQLKSIADFQVLLQREAFAESEPDILVRDYVEGDSLRQVHWKMTAREQKLKIRTRTGEENQGISVFCETKRYGREMEEYLPLENKMLEVLLALGFFFAGKEVGFTAYCGQNEGFGEQVQGLKHFDAFYRSVAETVFKEEEDIGKLLERTAGSGMLWNSKVIFLILHTLDEEIMEITERLTTRGMIVVIYVVTDRDQEFYLRQSSERRRIVTIPTEAELEGGM